MERKLIPQGLGGYTIYLPKKWITKKGLQEGDVVTIREFGNDLIISENKQKEREVSITLSEETNQYLSYWLTHIYRKNFSRIIISGVLPPIKTIEKVVDSLLLGFVITTYSKTSCIIENLAEPGSERYEVLLKRLFFIIKDNILSLQTALEKKNISSLDEVITSRGRFDKYVLFCKRTIYKERYAHDPLIHWELLTFLTHIQHAITYFADELRKDIPSSEILQELLLHLGDYFQLLYTSFFSLDPQSFLQIMKKREQYHFGGIQKILQSPNGCAIAVYLSHLQHIFRLVQITASPVFELYLEQQT